MPLSANEELEEAIAAQRALEVRDLAYTIADELSRWDIENHTTLTSGDWWDTGLLQQYFADGLDEITHRVTRARRYLLLRGKATAHPVFPKLIRLHSEDPSCPG
jgi:hypothetical protein